MHQSKKHYIVGVFLLGLIFVFKAQNAYTFAQIDSISYRLYQEQNWKALDKFCRIYINKQNDYYYLRMRAGIAGYELGKYRTAAKHFQIAKALGGGDDITNNYLKYAYIFSNRNEEAQQLEQRKKHQAVLKNYNAVSLEGGSKISNVANIGPAYLGAFNLWHSLGKNNSFLHSINTYNQDEERYQVNQLQYYIRYSRAFKQNYKVQMGFHYVFSRVSAKNYLVLEPKGFTHPPPPLVQTLTTIPFDAPTFTTVILPAKLNHEFIGSVNLIKQGEKLDLNVGGTLTQLDTTNLQQVNAGFVVYPFGNNKLQVGMQTYVFTYAQTFNFYSAFAPNITFVPFKNMYVQAGYFYNKNVNIIEQTGQLVNNSIDYTVQRFTISPSLFIGKHTTLYGTYIYELKQRLGDGLQYHYQLFYLGTKFNF